VHSGIKPRRKALLRLLAERASGLIWALQNSFSEPTLISEITRNKSRSEQTKRANPFEVNRILNMLIDERYPTCGVYRRFEEGRLSDEQLLEAISHEFTGSFIEGERYKEAVEGCVRMLKEEEGIA
jgi:hypothetical protein